MHILISVCLCIKRIYILIAVCYTRDTVKERVNEMTQYEILKMASIGISSRMAREEEINELTKNEYGRENRISVLKLEKLSEQFLEVMNLIGEIEKNRI